MVHWADNSRLIQCERGAYAIEFALVFVVLFVVLYAILTYGFVFMAQQSLNRAANAGVRTLLTWQHSDDMARINAAKARINSFSGVGWVRQMAQTSTSGDAGAVRASVCIRGQGAQATEDPLGVCPAFEAALQDAAGVTAATVNALVVVRYDYQQAPLIPILGTGVLKLPVPAVLEAQAQIDLGISYPGQPEMQ